MTTNNSNNRTAVMVEQGIAEERIEVKSCGDKEPAVPNDSDANRKLNRPVWFYTTVVP